MATTLTKSMFDRHVSVAPPPGSTSPFPALTASHKLFALTCLILERHRGHMSRVMEGWRRVTPPLNVERHCSRIRWKSSIPDGSLSGATNWCGQAGQEEVPLEGLGTKMRSEMLWRHNPLLLVWLFAHYILIFYLPALSIISSQIKVWRWGTRQTCNQMVDLRVFIDPQGKLAFLGCCSFQVRKKIRRYWREELNSMLRAKLNRLNQYKCNRKTWILNLWFATW